MCNFILSILFFPHAVQLYVLQCQLYWQSNGDYLCAQVTRHSRTGRTEFTNFELCRIRGTNYPMEVVGVDTYVSLLYFV